MAASTQSSESETISVQELIKDPKITVPQRYIRFDGDEASNLLTRNIPSVAIPTIDLQYLVSEEDAEVELEKLQTTCKDWGIFQLVNHGVSFSLLEKLKHDLEEFYKLPIEDKMKYQMRPGDFQGFGSTARSGDKLDWGDRFYMITNPIHRKKPYLLPELPSSLRNTLETYLMELEKLAMKLLGIMARALKMELKEMEKLFEDGMQSMRMTYYPPCPQPELVMGLTPHSDATGITILNQVNGVDGLQIKLNGVWFPVTFHPDSLVVNVGDILEIISNGVYRSIEHRATVNSLKERISVAFFVNPKFEAEIGPATSLINPENPPVFKRMGMEEYVNGFFARKLEGKSYLQLMRINNGEASNSA